MDWFRHDIYAQQDIKIRKLILHHGYEAYGLYWHAMEMLYQNEGQMDRSDFEDMFEEHDGIVFAFVTYGLVFVEGDRVFSNRVLKEIEFDTDMKKKKSEAGKKGMESRWKNNRVITGDNRVITEDNTLPYHTIPINNPPVPKGTSPLKGGSAFKKPTLDEVKAYCQERDNGIDPESFIAFYESNGWKVGKNPMKDWKAAVRTWEARRREDSKPKQRTNKMVEDLDERRRLNASIDPRTGEIRNAL